MAEGGVAPVPGTAIGAGDYFGFLNNASVEGTEDDLNGIAKNFDCFLPSCVEQQWTKKINRRKSQQAVAQTVFLNEASPFWKCALRPGQ